MILQKRKYVAPPWEAARGLAHWLSDSSLLRPKTGLDNVRNQVSHPYRTTGKFDIFK
jgi:hypothetical protein